MQFTFFHIKSNLMLCHVCCSLPHYLSLISMLFLTFKVGTCEVTQSCLTLCNSMDCSPADSSVHGDSPGKNTGVGCHALLQGIFPTQRSNPGLPHCRQTLYRLSYQGRTSNIFLYNQIEPFFVS